MADRYTYIPMIGFTLSLVWLISELWGPSLGRRLSLTALAALALIGCAAASRQQLRYWRNSITLFEHAIEVTPDNPVTQCNLGHGLVMEGKPGMAAVHYRAALAIKPNFKQAHYNLAAVLSYQQKWAEAAVEYQIVLGLDPKLYQAHAALAEILPHLNRTPEAVSHMETALLFHPDLPPELLNDLAWLLATSPRVEERDGEHAVQFAERACALTQYHQTTMVGTLAAAYAEAGRFSDAVATAEKARALASQAGDAVLRAKNQDLLELYRAGRPYREPAGLEQ
jgi:tetratricopeptide (TPR) repeat protein